MVAERNVCDIYLICEGHSINKRILKNKTKKKQIFILRFFPDSKLCIIQDSIIVKIILILKKIFVLRLFKITSNQRHCSRLDTE